MTNFGEIQNLIYKIATGSSIPHSLLQLKANPTGDATKPTQQAMFRNGELSGFGREIKYLESKGYRYNPQTNQMVKVKP